MLLRIIHIDDNQQMLTELKNLILQFPEVDYIGGYTNASEGIEAIIKHKPDLLFLDVEIGNSGETIFDHLKNVHINSQIVIVSNHEKYALQAFKIRAINYILKPALAEDVSESLSIARNNILLNKVQMLSDLVKEYKGDKQKNNTRIEISTAGKIYFEQLEDIEFVEADGNYTIFHKTNGDKITSSKILKIYKNIFTEKPNFIEVSRSAIANIDFLKVIVKEKQRTYIQMTSGKKLEVSRLRKDEVISNIKNYNQ